MLLCRSYQTVRREILPLAAVAKGLPTTGEKIPPPKGVSLALTLFRHRNRSNLFVRRCESLSQHLNKGGRGGNLPHIVYIGVQGRFLR
jgi:hypothetical protein